METGKDVIDKCNGIKFAHLVGAIVSAIAGQRSVGLCYGNGCANKNILKRTVI